jgi:outer membrane protein OmpU
MKKVLFATTALIATAGVASADMGLTGSAVMGYKDSGTLSGTHTDIEFNSVASGTSDNGLSFGASLDVDGNTTAASTGNTFGEAVGDTEVFVSGAFGTITIGDVGVATDFGVGDVGFDGVGADDDGLKNQFGDDVASGATSNITHDIAYSYSINGLTIYAGYDSVNDDSSVSLSYTVAGFTGTVAQATDANSDDTSTVAMGSYTMDGLTLAAMVTDYEDANTTTEDSRGTAVAISYAVTPELTVKAVASQNDNGTSNDTDASGIGFTYNMGGGLSLAGGVGNSNTNRSTMDLGLSMSF